MLFFSLAGDHQVVEIDKNEILTLNQKGGRERLLNCGRRHMIAGGMKY